MGNYKINSAATFGGSITSLIGGYRGTCTHSNTLDRTYTLPDKDGTFAMLSDIVAGGGVTLDTAQTITGLKSFQQGDNAALGAECITAVADRDFSAAGAWTGTGWSIVSGALAHTAGANAATLPNTSLNITPTSGVVYLIAMKIITTTLGTVTLSFGGVSLGVVAGQWVGTVNVNKHVVATGAGVLTVTPDATWVGSIDDISIKIITRSTLPSMRLFTTAGGTAAEIRNYNNTNLGIGNSAHRSNSSGTHNYALGYFAQAGLTTGIANIAIGTETQELLTNGTHNIGIGYFTQSVVTSSSYNIGIGGYAQRYLTTGFNNVALGFQAQQALTVGWNNMALGAYAQMALTTGNANVAIGKSSQTALTTGSQNMGIGGNSLLKVTTGSYNVAIGNNSGYNIVTSNNNTGIGTDTLFNATTSDNTAIGYGSLTDLTTGGYNTALGSLSGDGVTNATITYCSFFGYNARSTTDGITNSTAIGNGAVVTASNQIQLGNTSVTSINTSASLTLGGSISATQSISTTGQFNGGGGGLTGTASSLISGSTNKVNWLGQMAATDPGNTRGPGGLNYYGVYSNGYPCAYGNLLHMGSQGGNQLLLGWSGADGSHADNYIRSKRDNDTGAWSPWAKIITDVNIKTIGIPATATTLDSLPTGVVGMVSYFNDGTTQSYLPWMSGDSYNTSNYSQKCIIGQRINTGSTGIFMAFADGTGSSYDRSIEFRGNGSILYHSPSLDTVISFTGANTWNKAQNVAQVTLTASSSVAVDASLSNNFIITANTAAWALNNPTNLVAGQTLNISIVQDATGGRIVTFGTLYKFPTGASKVLSTAPNAVDHLSCYYNGSILICNLIKAMA